PPSPPRTDRHSSPTRRSSDLPDGGDHGDRAFGNGADDALVAEGEEILEAAAAAGQDEHVDVLVLAEGADRGHYLGGGGFEDLLRSEEHTSELQSLAYLVCRLL